jgi:UDP-N-acetylmuramoyl-tripeptide--D-alanyl-D-alanine ligase
VGIEEPIWTSAELGAACGAITGRPWYADGLQTVAAKVLPGDLYIALENELSDGHRGVAEALERGAVAAVVSGDACGVAYGDQRLAHVSDTAQALKLMAHHARGRAPAKVIGVTGSEGKASVVHALNRALAGDGQNHASQKGYEPHVGVSLSVARMPRETRFGIFELGMSRVGKVATGAKIAQPDVAVITTVGSVHAADMQEEKMIAGEKAGVIDALPAGAMAVIGVDHPYSDLLLERARAARAMAITVSVLGDADVKPVRMTEHFNCTCLTADIFGTEVTYKIAQPGRDWALNSLLVLAAVKAVGGDLGQAAMSLASLEAPLGRGRVHSIGLETGAATLIDESFNANPLATRAALRRLSLASTSAKGQRIAVLAESDDREKRQDEYHLSIVGDLKRFGVNKLVAFGSGMAEVGKLAGVETEVWADPQASVNSILAQVRHGDTLLVKGAENAPLFDLVAGLLAGDHQHSSSSVASGRLAAY